MVKFLLKRSGLLLPLLWVLCSAPSLCAQPTIEVSHQHGSNQGLLSVQAKAAPLPEILELIEKQTGIAISLVGQEKFVSVTESFVDMPFLEAIQTIISPLKAVLVADTYRLELSLPTHVWVLGQAFSALAGDSETGQVNRQALYQIIDLSIPQRLYLVAELEKLSTPKSISLLAYILATDRESSVRRKALWALTQSPVEQGQQALETGLADDDYLLRIETIQMLDMSHGEEALPSIGQVLFNEPDPLVRLEAVYALAEHQTLAAQSLLQVAAKDENSIVREVAADLLTQRAE